MICDEVRIRLGSVASLEDPALLDHLEGCESCTALAEERGLLGIAEPIDEPELELLFQRTEARIAIDRSTAGWLKSRPTWMRSAMAGASSVLVFACVVMLLRRPDFDAYPKGRMVATIATIAALLIASLLLGLRPIHRPRLPEWVYGTLTTAGVLAALVFAVLPSGYNTSAEWMSDTLIHPLGMRCFFLGLIFGVPVYAVARLLDRGGNPISAILAALAAGLTSNLVLHVHCPRSDPTHLVFGHFAAVLAFVVTGAALVWIEARFGRKNVVKDRAWAKPKRS